MAIERALQLEILKLLAAAYPIGVFCLVNQIQNSDPTTILANMFYLEEHQLIDTGTKRFNALSGEQTIPTNCTSIITAKGLDFLEDDGGLGAILGTTIVKLHTDTIKELLINKVEQSDKTPAEKSLLRKNIETMSGEATKTATKYLMDQGLAHLPDVAQWLQTIFRP